MVRVVFNTYCGLAGDLQELLIAKSDIGMTKINQKSCFLLSFNDL